MVWEEKMSISEVSEFSILPYTWNRKLGNLGKFILLQVLITSFARLKPFAESQINVSRQINKDTVYKEAPIYECFFLNDVNCFLRSLSKEAGALL